jgi:hypothetical protein
MNGTAFIEIFCYGVVNVLLKLVYINAALSEGHGNPNA